MKINSKEEFVQAQLLAKYGYNRESNADIQAKVNKWEADLKAGRVYYTNVEQVKTSIIAEKQRIKDFDADVEAAGKQYEAFSVNEKSMLAEGVSVERIKEANAQGSLHQFKQTLSDSDKYAIDAGLITAEQLFKRSAEGADVNTATMAEAAAKIAEQMGVY